MNAPFNTPSPRYSEALDWIDSNDSPEATESTRDETLRQIAAHLRDHFGVLRAEAFELMTRWSLANCDAPPQPAEIEQIVKRAFSAKANAQESSALSRTIASAL